MTYPVDAVLSPSRVSAFTDCALAFRFAKLDGLPEAPSPHAIKGSLVHAALEALFALPAPARTEEAGAAALQRAAAALAADPEFVDLGLDPGAASAFVADAQRMLTGYFAIEDPRQVHAIGVELRLCAQVDGVEVTGIIDRLDRLPSGDLVVVDYKTGHAPSERYEHASLLGVDTYALLCERVLGVRPVAVRLLYVTDGVVITRRPSDRTSRFIERKLGAVWQSIERLSVEDAFEPRPSGRCDWCSYRVWCPAFGGDADQARQAGRHGSQPRLGISGEPCSSPGDGSAGEELRRAALRPGDSGADTTVAALGDPVPDPAPAASG